MKIQTVLEAPEIREMSNAGFERMGMFRKEDLQGLIERSVPWRKWFFAPIWQRDVEAWYRD